MPTPGCTVQDAKIRGADGLKPGKTPSVNNYSTPTTDTTAAVKFDYYSFPQCPLSPTAYTGTESSNAATTAALSPYHPDINQKMPSAPPNATTNTSQYSYSAAKGLQTPPPQCWVKSRVTCNGGQACNLPTDTIDTNPPPVAAVCPDGYAQVGSFDMQPEITNTPGSNPIVKNSPTDIPDMKTYNYLVSLGYQCSVPTTPGYNQSLWSQCTAAPAGEYNSYTFNYARNVAYLNPNTQNGVVMFDRIYRHDSKTGNTNYCYTGAGGKDCNGTADAACDLQFGNGYPYYGPSTSTANVYLNGGSIDYYTKFEYKFGNVRCTLQPGLHFTKNMAPRAIMCARIQSNWNKSN